MPKKPLSKTSGISVAEPAPRTITSTKLAVTHLPTGHPSTTELEAWLREHERQSVTAATAVLLAFLAELPRSVVWDSPWLRGLVGALRWHGSAALPTSQAGWASLVAKILPLAAGHKRRESGAQGCAPDEGSSLGAAPSTAPCPQDGGFPEPVAHPSAVPKDHPSPWPEAKAEGIGASSQQSGLL